MGLRDWSRSLPQLGILPASTAPAVPEHYWTMGEANPPDEGITGGNDGTGSNVTVVAGMLGQALEFNGNNSNVNLGDVVILNSVSAFSICFWMNQDIIDQTDFLYNKGSNLIRGNTDTSGSLRLYISSEAFGTFDYSTVISAGLWYHLAVVFDGSQSTNATRLTVYIDGEKVTLTFSGTIPATTPDASGDDMIISYATAAFDGKIDDFRIYSSILRAAQVREVVNYRQ